jgi:two-component system sensor histidine kinase UhpB
VSATTRDDHGLARPGGTRRPRLAAPDLGLYARVLAVNASILVVAFLLLILTPVRVDPSVTGGQFAILFAGLVVMLASNALLLRFSMAPLGRLMGLMRSADVLQPGRRLDAGGTPEVAEVITAFNATLERLEDERRASMRRVLSAQEAERRRISQELHDQIGQNLTAVLLELRRLRGHVTDGWADTLADAQELARESLEELRRISYELRPAVLDDLGLASALAALSDAVSRRAQIEVANDVGPGVPALPPDVELAVYRIAQEALTNAVRHSGCTRVRVRLAVEGGAVYLRVADDGRGLGELPRSGGGIRGMRERALMIGGRLVLGVCEEGGVEVELSIPPAAAAA